MSVVAHYTGEVEIQDVVPNPPPPPPPKKYNLI